MTQTVKTIKNLMVKQGVSQRLMAEQIGVTEAAMCRWMQGTRNPSILYVEKMAKVLGYRLSMVITEGDANVNDK